MGEIKIDKIKSTTIVIDSSINLEGDKVSLTSFITTSIKSDRIKNYHPSFLYKNPHG
jgi:hypothetical protein